MSKFRVRLAATVAALALAVPALVGSTAAAGSTATTTAMENVVLQWNEAALQGVRDSKLGPPMVARALAIVHTCMYDAWAAYHKKAVGTRLGGSLRRPVVEHTLANKNKAISYGAYMALKDLMPVDTALYTDLMMDLGFDPNDTSTDTTTPQGIGNVACDAVLDFRHQDGSNQLGDHPQTPVPGTPYQDYTGYQPVNDPMDIREPFDPSTVHDVNRWQPLTYVDGTGVEVTPSFIAPHWTNVAPFALTSGDQYRSGEGPVTTDDMRLFRIQAIDLIKVSAALTDEQKLIAEYWADGPKSELPPGHWDLFAQFVSRRDGYSANTARGVDHDVRMFFALTNAIFDASIVAWDNKITFDSVRPITAIRSLFNGKTIEAWAGPYQGTQEIDGSEWFPYQPESFPTPPFAEYTSGHSTFSAAGAEILKIVTGSDFFGYSFTVPAGMGLTEPGLVPARDTTLYWATFRDAADSAGISRRYGGIHFVAGDYDARDHGTLLAEQAWAKAVTYFNGTAGA